MSRWPLWAVLAPGEPARLESRAYDALCMEKGEEDKEGPPFAMSLGSSRYHALVGTNPIDVGAEIQIAKELSLECDEPVFSIERANDPWIVMSWRKGSPVVLEEDPASLATSLDCPLPSKERTSTRTARRPLRTVALREGVQAEEARHALEEDRGEPLPPGHYYFKDTPQGLLLAGGKRGMNFAHITLSEAFPQATVYGVTASPSLDTFAVTAMQAGEGIERFTRPLRPDPCVPEVSKIKGENSPERILAALGIPAEWFRNE